MTPYDKLRAGNEKLKSVWQLDGEIVRTIPGAKDRATGKTTGSSAEVIPVKLAKGSAEILNNETGLRSKHTAFTVWHECRIGDVIRFAGETYTVSSIEERNPDGQALNWRAIVRSGA